MISSIFLWFVIGTLWVAAHRSLARRLPIVVAAVSALFGACFAYMYPAQGSLLAVTPLRLLLLAMIFLVAWAVVTYSKQALAEEPRKPVYWRWLYATLGAVTLVILSDHLLLLWGAWVAISLSLHKLLTFYPERPRAKLAAHKKFIVARVAELSLLFALVLLGTHFQTFYLSEVLLAWQAEPLLAPSVQTAAVLIALTALLKSAQLPVHGWLIQVVEAPTPVSALLHAGVVNLGGFLLLITAPITLAVPAAQWLVLVVAGLTAVLSALIMITRVSIKVKLAWSTSAQMGMMLVEIALGLYELALVHLIAHSIYKAYAFLSAGSAVNQTLLRRLSPAATVPWQHWLVAFVLATGLVLTATWAYANVANQLFAAAPMVLLSVLLLLIGAITMLVAQRHGTLIQGELKHYGLTALVLVGAYFGLKLIAHLFIPPSMPVHTVFLSGADLWISALVVALITTSLLLHMFPNTKFAKKLSMMLFAGLYLDEWSTRLTLVIWPIHTQPRASAALLTKKEGLYGKR
ncbi:NADH-quinone oxidoreductase subunit L [Aliidiomarina celeris]|uniref:NADH-quinone oxidoreductase subunit L n=1 Tax=Aliidiomarina celeris TaxID=2249428 RepID=UPI000DEB69D3|nr:NADH-quinone oxidoreductase subunit L [Aliidiomarina celeris]